VPASLRQAVVERAGGCCEYCQSQERFSPDAFSIEHVTPRSAKGADDAINLALSCQGCNNRKYTSTDAVDPVSGVSVPLFHPRTDRWAEHFAWNNDFTQIVALTPTGRATAEKLQLNRSGVMSLRRVLREMGEHPPRRVQG
jgi:hypothetical protein